MAPKMGPRIDTRPPRMFVETVLKTAKMVRDVERQRTILRENKELVKRINSIYRTKGFLNVDYNYRVHQSLNSETRGRQARAIERQNLALLNRLLRRKATVDSNLVRGRRFALPKPPGDNQSPGRRMVIDFWERTDRRLCQLAIDMCPEVMSFDEVTFRRGKLFRIYKRTVMVISVGNVRTDDELPDGYGTLQNVRKGSFVRQVLDGREFFLITLRTIERIVDGKLLGTVENRSMNKLDLINDYGTQFGRCKEPIYYDKIEPSNR